VSPDPAFEAAVREALRAPGGRPLAGRFPAPLVTAIVAGGAAAEGERLAAALAGTLEALERAGVPRGRQFVLLATGSRPAAAPLRAALGVPVLEHDPEGPHFVVGRAGDGTPFEVDDELREAEAIVVVGPEAAGEGGGAGLALLCPGVVSARTAAACALVRARAGGAAAGAFVLELERGLGVDLAVTWDARGAVLAEGGRERFEAMARAGPRA